MTTYEPWNSIAAIKMWLLYERFKNSTHEHWNSIISQKLINVSLRPVSQSPSVNSFNREASWPLQYVLDYYSLRISLLMHLIIRYDNLSDSRITTSVFKSFPKSRMWLWSSYENMAVPWKVEKFKGKHFRQILWKLPSRILCETPVALLEIWLPSLTRKRKFY